MRSGSEADVQQGLQELLDGLAPGRFICTTRKTSGSSVIGKPVDLEIRSRSETIKHALMAVEVANVNTTQLVGEAARLYFDNCPIKLLVLGDRNAPPNSAKQCELVLARLYGQDHIEYTPARVVWYFDDERINRALCELMFIDPSAASEGKHHGA